MVNELPDIELFTKKLQKVAWVEVVCGVDHASIYVPSQGWVCRYSRGMVTHVASGLIIRAHSCHLCNGYWLLSATTPPEKQLCDNCGGPAQPTGEPSCWPDLLVVNDFVEPAR
jgi:hypothetical protein